MRQLDLSIAPRFTSSIKTYFRFYDINFENINHYFGTFEFGDKRIVAHIFFQNNSRGTVFLIHGYNDHTGILKNLIHFCLKQNFSVAVYDLPGHGLSTGEPGCINDFSEYADILKTFIHLYQNHVPEPFFLICHSLGCAIAFEYMNNNQNHNFKKVILLAPLIHQAHWEKSKIGYFLTKPFFKTLPRIFRKNSSDPNFIEFIKNDPLQNRRIPIKFLTAL